VKFRREGYRTTVSNVDRAAIEYLTKQKEIMVNLEGFLARLKALKKRIAKRDAVLLDYDKWKTEVIKLQARRGKDHLKLFECENKFENYKDLFKKLNEELTVELREELQTKFQNLKKELDFLIEIQHEMFSTASKAYMEFDKVGILTDSKKSLQDWISERKSTPAQTIDKSSTFSFTSSSILESKSTSSCSMTMESLSQNTPECAQDMQANPKEANLKKETSSDDYRNNSFYVPSTSSMGMEVKEALVAPTIAATSSTTTTSSSSSSSSSSTTNTDRIAMITSLETPITFYDPSSFRNSSTVSESMLTNQQQPFCGMNNNIDNDDNNNNSSSSSLDTPPSRTPPTLSPKKYSN